MDCILETRNLFKSFKEKTAVNDVSLHVQTGEIYGFAGPNGAGKSTVMKMLMQLTQPDSGEVYLFGEKMKENSYESFKRIGSIIESPCFYEAITGWQNLELHCEYMGYYCKERIDEVLQLTGLQDAAGRRVLHYSLGMKQRLAIARAILTKPQLLILDEPVNALDPEGIRQMRELFQRLNRECGTTIFISSHLLSEVEQIAGTIGIIQSGRLLQEISMPDIRKIQSGYIVLETDNASHAAFLLEHKSGIADFKAASGTRIEIYDLRTPVPEIARMLVQNGAAIISIGRKQSSLEDYFFHVLEDAQNATPGETANPSCQQDIFSYD